MPYRSVGRCLEAASSEPETVLRSMTTRVVERALKARAPKGKGDVRAMSSLDLWLTGLLLPLDPLRSQSQCSVEGPKGLSPAP